MNIQNLVKTQERITQAAAAASEADLSLDSEVTQIVSFTLGDVEYGIDILLVHEILRIPEITRLPNAPSFIRGVINLRGNVIPVVDVRERFGFSKVETNDLSRIIVIETDGRLVGLFVDNVSQVIRISEKNIDPPSALIEGVSEDFIAGIGRLNDRLIVILQMKFILFEKSSEQIAV